MSRKDPKDCALPHCPWRANGHDWIVYPRADGGGNAREGYCSQAHARLASDMLGGLPHELILESDPADNFEDRVRKSGKSGKKGGD
jgi:hypothetical protein